MTNEQNEEKAEQIAQYHCANKLNLIQAYNAALDMAEWKDEQFAIEKEKLIDKACEFWEHKFPYIGVDTIKEFVDTMKGGE